MAIFAGKVKHATFGLAADSAASKPVNPSSLGSVGLRTNLGGTALSFWTHPAVLDSCLHIGAYLGAADSSVVRVPAALTAFSNQHMFGATERCYTLLDHKYSLFCRDLVKAQRALLLEDLTEGERGK